MNPAGRILDRVEERANGCLNYTGFLNSKGYGRFGRGQETLAHRIVWIQKVGAIPKGMSICHHCDNPSCVNPSHLFIGTHADNMRDRHEKGRYQGLRGLAHPMAKLTPEQVKDIRSTTESSAVIGRLYGISPSYVRGLRRGYGRKDAA